jgi:poly(3-hydroxybutyrate) depolymerase
LDGCGSRTLEAAHVLRRVRNCANGLRGQVQRSHSGLLLTIVWATWTLKQGARSSMRRSIFRCDAWCRCMSNRGTVGAQEIEPGWISPSALNGEARLSEVTDFGANPGALRMMLYAPRGLTATSPLVVVLHGSTQTADTTPRGPGGSLWQIALGLPCFAPSRRETTTRILHLTGISRSDIAREGGEASLIGQMVQRALADYDIDAEACVRHRAVRRRAKTAVMLVTYPEVFVAGAVIAGPPYGAASNMLEAWGAPCL